MPYELKDKLVIAIASSALFDLSESHRIYRTRGRPAYERYQIRNESTPLKTGVAYPFVRRLLQLNPKKTSARERLVEVVLLSQNSANTGLRVMNSIAHYKLDIRRAAFTTGRSPYRYLESFDASLFLSADARSVRDAIENGFAAGRVLHSTFKDDLKDRELRIAFDFDGVLAGDESEQIYKLKGIKAFHKHEHTKARRPMAQGPLYRLMKKLAHIQKIKARERKAGGLKIRTAIVTARSAPAHHRLVTTLRAWGFDVNEALFLGGLEKARCLAAFRPHIFFDDQSRHLSAVAPCVHVPFGISNAGRTVKK